MQGCTLRKITRGPKVPNCEIQGTQHKAYNYEKSRLPEAPRHPYSTALYGIANQAYASSVAQQWSI